MYIFELSKKYPFLELNRNLETRLAMKTNNQKCRTVWCTKILSICQILTTKWLKDLGYIWYLKDKETERKILPEAQRTQALDACLELSQ